MKASFVAIAVAAHAQLPLGVPEVTAAGTWKLSRGREVILSPNGTASASGGDSGTWKLEDAVARRYAIRWKTGAQDAITLANDANRLEGSIEAVRFIDPIAGVWSGGIVIRADAVIYTSDGTRGTWTRSSRAIAVEWESGASEVWTWREDGTGIDRSGGAVALRRGSDLVIGVFQGTHRRWSDTVALAAGGTFRRGNGDAGRWSFDGRTLILGWKSGGPEALNLQLDGTFSSQDGGFRLVRRSESR